MKIDKQDIDNLNAKVSVIVEKNDYLPKYNEQLAKYRKDVSLKGFRKGKTPMGVVKRMYGKAILVEAVNEKLQESIVEYFENAEFKIIGQPMDTEENAAIVFDPNALIDYNFNFDVGIQPEFEIVDMEEGIKAERIVPLVDDATIDEELATTQKQAGIQVAVDDVIEENDIIEVSGVELEGDEPKDDGIDSTFTLLIKNVGEAYKEELLKKKTGDTFRFKMSDIEGEERSDTYIRKYLMKVEDEEKEVNDTWEGKIIEVKRLKPAELNKEFFDKAFGEEAGIEDEAGAKEKIRSIIEDFYFKQADQMMFKDIEEKLKKKNDFELPQIFLKRWLKEINPEMAEEQFDEEFPKFIENTKWDLVKGKFAEKHALKVEEEELRNEMVNRFTNAYGKYNLPQEMMVEQLKKMMQDQQMVQGVANQLLENKIFYKLKEMYTITDKEISMDDFKELLNPPKPELVDEKA